MPKLCRHVDGNAASPSSPGRAAPAPSICFALPQCQCRALLATFILSCLAKSRAAIEGISRISLPAGS